MKKKWKNEEEEEEKKEKQKQKKRKIKMLLGSFFAFIKILESFEEKSILNLFQPYVIR
jgi:hypothetical protein